MILIQLVGLLVLGLVLGLGLKKAYDFLWSKATGKHR